eukprot:m.196072 g.196072  ORF g.196072 m.196072 type:complete len:116 (+) comp53737_c0_seq3:1486-1833(+)
MQAGADRVVLLRLMHKMLFHTVVQASTGDVLLWAEELAVIFDRLNFREGDLLLLSVPEARLSWILQRSSTGLRNPDSKNLQTSNAYDRETQHHDFPFVDFTDDDTLELPAAAEFQ